MQIKRNHIGHFEKIIDKCLMLEGEFTDKCLPVKENEKENENKEMEIE